MTNCGPGGSGTESCCTGYDVTGGTYYRTYNTAGTNGGYTSGTPDGGWPDLADPATVSTFSLDKYLVTVGRFRQFVNATATPDGGVGWFPPVGSGKHTYVNGGQGLVDVGAPPDAGTVYESGWDATNWSNTTDIDPTDANLGSCSPSSTWTSSSTGGQENLPINCITWYEAYAFCIWDGGFLPSEAEWEYAAAGGSQELDYPWGSVTPGLACPGTGCDFAIYNCLYPNGSTSFFGNCSGVSNIAPVGYPSMGKGVWGQLDLAGALSEWALDSYANYVDPCTDCTNLESPLSAPKVIRGGQFDGALSAASYLLPPYRNEYTPAFNRNSGVGFRCARTP
jgi:formylglycine-generating enzyme required for sulfatase activity